MISIFAINFLCILAALMQNNFFNVKIVMSKIMIDVTAGNDISTVGKIWSVI